MANNSKREVLFHRADFLNKRGYHSDASIFSKLVVSADKKFSEQEFELSIRDCSKQISLAIYAYSEEEMQNVLYKLDTLIDHLSELRSSYESAYRMYDELTKKIDAE